MKVTIPEFYAGKGVIITGSTGFLGKALVEKLLRSCPEIKKVFLLVRDSKDKGAKDRVAELLQEDLFETVRANQPNLKDKVVAVPAEISKPKLGLAGEESAALVAQMREEASVIMHCAATVNFNEKLDISLTTNVVSVKNLLEFAKSLRVCHAFVHVSTAYAHCDRPHIEEKIYAPAVDPDSLISTLSSLPAETIASVTPGFVGKRPNTYTFTKSLAEAVVGKESDGIPVGIVRPSIVGSVWRDPLPGWTDNLNGPGGFYIAVGHNILRVMPGNKDKVTDIVPVDYVINMIIAVGAKVGDQIPEKPLVFNCTSGRVNPLHLGDQRHYILKAVRKSPITNTGSLYVPFVTLAAYDYIWGPLLHTGPARLIDLYRSMIGKKPTMTRIYKRLDTSLRMYAFFSSQEWTWDDHNSRSLEHELTLEDRALFSLSLTELNWEKYVANYYEGCKKFLTLGRRVKGGMTVSADGPPSQPSAAAMSSSPSSLTLVSSPSSLNLFSSVAPNKKALTSTIWFLVLAVVVIVAYDFFISGDIYHYVRDTSLQLRDTHTEVSEVKA